MFDERTINQAVLPKSRSVSGWQRTALGLGFAMFISAGPGAAICGDCDVNGVIDVGDVLVLAQHVSGANILSGPRLMDCDVNRDGPVNVLDVLLLTQVSAGIRPASDLVCTDCGDCNMNGTSNDGTDVDVIPVTGTIVAATSGQAACDTNGDGFLDFVERPTFMAQTHGCVMCGDGKLDADVDFDDAKHAASGNVPMGRSFSASSILGVSPNVVNVLDALQIAQFDAGLLPTLMCEDPNLAQP